MLGAGSKGDGNKSINRRPWQQNVPTSVSSLPHDWAKQKFSSHTLALSDDDQSNYDEKAIYREQLQLNQKLIAERFQSEALNARSRDVERGAVPSRDEPAVRTKSYLTKQRLQVEPDSDEPQPGVQFVPHEGLGLNLDSILVRLARANSRRPSTNAAGNAVDLSSPASTAAAVEQSNPDPNRKQWYKTRIVATVLVILVIVAVVLGVLLVNKRSNDTRTTGFESATAFDPISLDCDKVISQVNPHVITQCKCYGKIFKVAADIKGRYEGLTQTLVPTVEANFRDNLDSCSPENQALLWLASSDGTATGTTMQQRYKLALLFILWNGASWNEAKAWLSSASECTWYGVTCSNNETVTDIVLTDNNLMGDLNKVLLLPSLTSLDLSRNNFRNSTLPRDIGLLKNLSSMELSLTGIHGTIPTELFKLGDTLVTLAVDNNHLSGTIPTLIGKLTNLNLWLVGNNKFTGTIPSEIGRCTKVTLFDANGNALNGTIPTQVGKMVLLDIFALQDNQLTGTIPSELGSCYLSKITLRNNNLNGT